MAIAVWDGPRPVIPSRDYEQRMDALKEANRIRTWRKEMKLDLKARRVSFVALLEAPPMELETMKVWDLLILAPKVGRVKLGKMFRSANISPSKTVGGLSERQRRELLSVLAVMRWG